mgnify:CR=1 FL=1
MDNPIIVCSCCYKLKIRITDSFSFDYADSPYHLITSSPLFHGLLADTFSSPSKSPQKLITYSSYGLTFLPEHQCFILNYAV